MGELNGATVIATGRTLSKVEKTAELLKEYDVVPYKMDCGLEQDWIDTGKLAISGHAPSFTDFTISCYRFPQHSSRYRLCRAMYMQVR